MRMTATRVRVQNENYQHESLMTAAREKHPDKPLCPDCYLPFGAHRHGGGQRCEVELPSAIECARSHRIN